MFFFSIVIFSRLIILIILTLKTQFFKNKNETFPTWKVLFKIDVLKNALKIRIAKHSVR